MKDDIDPLACAEHAIAVTNIADQETKIPIRVAVALVELLGLVPSEDADDRRIELEKAVDQASPDRPGPSGYEHAPPTKILRLIDDGVLPARWGPRCPSDPIRAAPAEAGPDLTVRYRPPNDFRPLVGRATLPAGSASE
jgi:hypothetical protein